MQQYLNLVETALRTGQYKQNRTAVDTISTFSANYTIDLQEGFPLLTTKDLSGYRWESLIHELCWYLSGEEHIRNLRENTKIWNAWADDEGRLDTAYGRFWRRYPIPQEADQLEGETWASVTDGRWDTEENVDPQQWVNNEGKEGERTTFDQIQYIIDQLNENPNTRRLVVSAWHPANATVSTLPPCHYTFVFNVQGDKLNCHLTQRSGDIALGIPFNIAAYSILTTLIAKQTGFTPGEFSHEIVDAHVYCGSNERGEWYSENLDKVQAEMESLPSGDITPKHQEVYQGLVGYIEENAPEEADENEHKDHVTGLLKQLTRDPKDRPTLKIVENTTVDTLTYEDIWIENYNPHPSIEFSVAE